MGHDGLERVRDDLAAGRLWKARDRVTGMVAGRPADQGVLELAGRVFFEMGDLPRAGAYWFLTERSGPEAEAAVRALHERHGHDAVNVIKALPVRNEIDAYPRPVAERLRELQGAAKDANRFRWDPAAPRQPADRGPEEPAWKRLVNLIGGGAALLATIGVWLVGWMAIVSALLCW